MKNFFKCIIKNDIKDLYDLKNEIINYYTQIYQGFELGEFNLGILKFPNFKKEGTYENLTFRGVGGNDENKKYQIFNLFTYFKFNKNI